jgi:hypothetical protein
LLSIRGGYGDKAANPVDERRSRLPANVLLVTTWPRRQHSTPVCTAARIRIAKLKAEPTEGVGSQHMIDETELDQL